MRRSGAVAAITCCLLTLTVLPAGASSSPTVTGATPRTPIEHVVTVMQEGHSFDNYFGTFPGAAGIPDDVCVPQATGAGPTCVKPFAIGRQPLASLDHDRSALEVARNGGSMNGFVAAQGSSAAGSALAMGHYRRSDLPYYWNLAAANVLFDHFFAASSGGSVANHLSWVAGTEGGLTSDAIPASGLGALPTIFDRLQAAGLSWKFYVQNYDSRATYRRGPHSERSAQVGRVPLLGYARYVDDPKLFSHIVPISQYYADLAERRLPSVSYIVPSGTSERPPSDIHSGERFVRSLVDGLSASPEWSTSAFILTYDSWGGWYDHVAPPRVDPARSDPADVGFRVPTLLVSPFARRGYVDHTRLDSTSILRFIEQNWSLAPLGARDAAAASLVHAFDFTTAARPPTLVPANHAVPTVARARTGVAVSLYLLALVAALALVGAVVWRTRARPKVVLW